MTINRGFTLIEILVVIIIIGITIGFAIMSYGDFGESRRRTFAMEQLVNTLKLAQQQAILESGTLGLRIDNTSYQILRFKNGSSWEPISNKGVFKSTYLPKNTIILLKTNSNTPAGFPSIVITSSGNMTPFTLNFGVDKDHLESAIIGSHDGSLSFVMVKSK